MKLALPPLPFRNTPTPRKTGNFMDMGVFHQKEAKMPGVHKIGAAIFMTRHCRESKREADTEFQYQPRIVDTDIDCRHRFCGHRFRDSYYRPRTPRKFKDSKKWFKSYFPLSDPIERPLSRDTRRTTPVALCFLWYRRQSLNNHC